MPPRATKVPNTRRPPAPQPQPVKKTTTPPQPQPDAIAAMKNVEKTLEQLREEERREGFAKASTKVMDTDWGWKMYIKPPDTTNIEECARVDEYNLSIQEYNNASAPKINDLMKLLGRPSVSVDPPPKYKAIALRKKEEMLFDKNFRIMMGVQFLAERQIYPVRDYEIYDAPIKADEVAAQEEARRLISAAGEVGIDISKVVGTGHANNCTCENKWDGESERCMGGGIRLQWRKMKNHHFLRPVIQPEQY